MTNYEADFVSVRELVRRARVMESGAVSLREQIEGPWVTGMDLRRICLQLLDRIEALEGAHD